MDVLHWVVFSLLPGIAAILFGVGVGGAKCLAMALTIAICLPFALAYGWPGWIWGLDPMHGEPRQALWWILLFGGFLGTADDFKAIPKPVTFGLEILLVSALPWIVSTPLRAAWSFDAYSLCLSAGWCLTVTLWLGLRRFGEVYSGLSLPLGMTIVLGVDTWILRSATGGQDWKLAGVAAVALGFAMITTIWRRPFVCGSGAAMTITLMHTGLLLCGRSERDLLQLPVLLAWIAPLPMWLVAVPYFTKRRVLSACLAVSLVTVCGGFAVWASVAS